MTSAPPNRRAGRHRVAPLYSPSGDEGETLLYGGDILVAVNGKTRRIPGQIEMCLKPTPQLIAHFEGPWRDLFFLDVDDISVSIPADASLAPPAESMLPQRPEGASWTTVRASRTEIEAGDLTQAESFVLHVAGGFKIWPPVQEVSDGGAQRQVSFRLPGADLTLAPVGDRRGAQGFAAVIAATTSEGATSVSAIDALTRRLFVLLSLIAGREVCVGPVCGLSANGNLVWARWSATRCRAGRAGARWCPDTLTAAALPALASCFLQLSSDSSLEVVIDRAVNHLLSANGDEVLDVRIPVACSGLELVGWAALQTSGALDRAALGALSAGETSRRLLEWAGIPLGIPDGFDALAARRQRLRESRWAGPEVLFSVRNKLVHPPNRIDSPEWPTADEMIEAWQLATWYLELAILRLLGYQGEYWPRLKLGQQEAGLEPVPWSD